MKAHAIDLRIARLTIDERLAGPGGVATDALASAVQAELADAIDGGREPDRRASSVSTGLDTRQLARTIADSVARRVSASRGMKP